MGWDLRGIELLIRFIMSLLFALGAVGCLLFVAYNMGISQGRTEEKDNKMDEEGI